MIFCYAVSGAEVQAAGYFTDSVPGSPRISKSKICYSLSDMIEVSAYAKNAKSYSLSMYKDGIKIVEKKAREGNFSMDAKLFGAGHYVCYFSCDNSAGTAQTMWLDFDVVGPSRAFEKIYQNITKTVLFILPLFILTGRLFEPPV